MTDFEEIYRTHFTDVYRYIRRLSNDEHIAEEITADTFFKAMQTIHKFRGDCDIRVWLCQIAKNSYLTYLEKHKHIDQIEDGIFQTVPDHAGTPEEQFLRQDDIKLIREILHEIAEPYKEVFMWRVFAELSFKQIGQIFGKSENWACVTYHRARLKIKERMEALTNEK